MACVSRAGVIFRLVNTGYTAGMHDTTKRFPEGFYWGAATASYQVEGGIENNDWARAAQEGRVPVCGQACDHYHKYEADFDIAKELGHTAHRLSIEWARIEPEPGAFDESAIEHYRQVLQALRDRNITPFVTLWHFTVPVWFADRGGFECSDAPELFARYCAYVTARINDLCDHVSTMNEPNVYASNGWLRGSWPPFQRFRLTDLVSITNSGRQHDARAERGVRPLWNYIFVMRHLAQAHRVAYQEIKQVAPTMTVSIVKHVIVFARGNWNPFNSIRAALANYLWTHAFMRRVYRHTDQIGLNYYLYVPFGDRTEWRKTDMDWNVAPEYIYDALMMLRQYRLPVFVSEAGVADAADAQRATYIKKQVEATWWAMQHGVDVRGHLYWSLLDNYEWALGFTKRFGLVAVDYETLERSVRPSAYVYKEIIANRGIVE